VGAFGVSRAFIYTSANASEENKGRKFFDGLKKRHSRLWEQILRIFIAAGDKNRGKRRKNDK